MTDKKTENAIELGLDYEPPCKTGSQCTSKCQQCEHPAQQSHCNDCGGFDPECPLVQPAQQQEPVAQEWRYYFSHSGATGKPDEVVGPCFTDRKEVAFGVGCFDQTALIPPANANAGKPWVWLTDEEMHECWDSPLTPLGMKHARMIEAKLREKNA